MLITVPARFAGKCSVEDHMNFKTVLHCLGRFLRAREAVSALEYAIVVGVVVAGVGGAVVLFTDDVEIAVAAIGADVKTTATSVSSENLAEQ